jgi:hypothetical protein
LRYHFDPDPDSDSETRGSGSKSPCATYFDPDPDPDSETSSILVSIPNRRPSGPSLTMMCFVFPAGRCFAQA